MALRIGRCHRIVVGCLWTTRYFSKGRNHNLLARRDIVLKGDFWPVTTHREWLRASRSSIARRAPPAADEIVVAGKPSIRLYNPGASHEVVPAGLTSCSDLSSSFFVLSPGRSSKSDLIRAAHRLHRRVRCIAQTPSRSTFWRLDATAEAREKVAIP